MTLPKETIVALQRLIDENQLLREAIENTPVPWAIYDQDLNLMAFSRAYTRTHPEMGRVIEETNGPVTYEHLMRRVLARQVPEDKLEEAVADRVDEFNHADSTPQDRYYPEFGWLRIIRYRLPSGALSGLAFDISELKEREQDLRRARTVAEESERLRAEFLANMSHEIRTPMNGVLGMAELLRNTELDDRQQMFADTIVRSGQDLLRIINDVLDVAKIEAGGIELDPAPFDPTEAIEDVITLMSGKAAEKGIHLAAQFVDSLPASVIGDGARLRQVLTNLISNAIKFTDEGHVLVRAVSLDVTRDGIDHSAELFIEVEDTGCGIPESDHTRIFQKFQQADTGGPVRQEGTGLGLPISHALMSLMGGEIGLDSIEGKGSTFRLRLELPIDCKSKALPENREGVEGSRILIVDDNAINRKILSEQLKFWNFEPIVTANGPKALEMIMQLWRSGAEIDLAIIDNRMPDMDGDELLRQIRLLPGKKTLPVVMLTSIDIPDATKRFAHLGLVACLIKPPRSSELYNAIVSAISQNREMQAKAS